MIAGIRTDLGIKIFGDDLEVLSRTATEAAALLETIPGAQDIYVEQITSQPILEVRADQAALARHGAPAQHVIKCLRNCG